MVEFFDRLAEYVDMMDLGDFHREGDGQLKERGATTVQASLEAPSLEELRAAVAVIPNDNDRFPDRSDYLKIGYAIRAAASADIDEGLSIFADWASKWEGNGASPTGNDPEVVRADWRRMRPPYIVGWNYLAELARDYGYNDAGNDFIADEDPPATVPLSAAAPRFSEQDLALRVVEQRGGELRYIPAQEKFLVWDNVRWRPDAVLLAEDLVKQELRKVANHVERIGASEKEQRDNQQLAITIASAHKASAVRTLLQSERSIAIGTESLDHDGWLLGTPGGTVDLRTGRMRRASPDDLITRITAVPPDFSGYAPEWRRFLAEATGGNTELEAYLQRLAGYALTGLTREQHLTFIWGPGGNGKSVFINTLQGVMGDYARPADMNTFTESKNERHSTELAHLHGARLVTASETQAGKRWDEAKVKALSAGEPVTARFMRQDNFTYMPQFKLVFSGNHKPPIRDLDDAMRRRIHLVPFDVTPKKVDRELPEKLRGEWPAILAWMIEGSLRWQEQGLTPPEIVRDTTEEYFEDEDAIGRWMAECVVPNPEAKFVRSMDTFNSWREWANRNGEYVGSVRRLVGALGTKHIRRVKDPVTRRSGFAGIELKEIGDFE
jgi:putative DNA primase/helicase